MPAPEVTAVHPEVPDWSEGVQVPSVPNRQSPTLDWWKENEVPTSWVRGRGV